MFLVRTHVNKWRDIVTYHGLVWSNISPPLGYRDIWQNNGEKNNNGGQDEARIKSRGGDIVVGMPPPAPTASDPVVEDEAKDNPRGEAQWGGTVKWSVTGHREQYREWYRLTEATRP